MTKYRKTSMYGTGNNTFKKKIKVKVKKRHQNKKIKFCNTCNNLLNQDGFCETCFISDYTIILNEKNENIKDFIKKIEKSIEFHDTVNLECKNCKKDIVKPYYAIFLAEKNIICSMCQLKFLMYEYMMLSKHIKEKRWHLERLSKMNEIIKKMS